ncbi:neutrophil defensin 3-like [Dipodomys spectabilis]|uniref:neutrophil defensin 3-like n=1 Tax=Dipodomys spectabilis TaxID=105255 RepID=UPI001C542E25|nr:neutrophil defensin 3-like [Dipodomys spectabilis]
MTMRTLALLGVLSLLALQAQGEPLRVTFEAAAAQEPLEGDGQVPSISLFQDDSSVLQDSGVQAGRNCYCRIGACQGGERTLGTCIYRNHIYRFCC